MHRVAFVLIQHLLILCALHTHPWRVSASTLPTGNFTFRICALFHPQGADQITRQVLEAVIEEINDQWKTLYSPSMNYPRLQLISDTYPPLETSIASASSMVHEIDKRIRHLLSNENVIALLQLSSLPSITGEVHLRRVVDHYLLNLSRQRQLLLLQFQTPYNNDILLEGDHSLFTGGPDLPSLNVNLAPKLDTVAAVLSDLTEHFHWRHFLFIHDDMLKLNLLEKLFEFSDLPANKHINTRSKMLLEHNVYELLDLILADNWFNILLDLNLSNTRRFLQAALNRGMIDRRFHYLLVHLDASQLNFENYRHNFGNITVLRMVGQQVWHLDSSVKSFLLNLPIAQKKLDKFHFLSTELIHTKAILVHDHMRLLQNALHQLAEESSMNFLHRLQRPMGGFQPLLYNTTSNDAVFQLWKLIVNKMTWPMEVEHGRLLSVANPPGLQLDNFGQREQLVFDILHLKRTGLRKVGNWTAGRESIQMLEQPFDVETVFPLKNRILRVVTVLQEPFVQLKRDAELREGRDKYEGYCIDLMESIANSSGFDWTIYVEPNNTYGVDLMEEDGGDESTAPQRWSGMVRELLLGNAEIALGAFTINYMRERMIDFTKPFMSLGISILFKKPEAEKPGLFSFLNPLSFEIWLYVLLAYVFVTLLIYTLARFSPYEWLRPHPPQPFYQTPCRLLHNTYTLSNSFWFTLGTLMQQGSDVHPRSVSTRLLSGIWWFFTLIIISSYTANLAAFLTIEHTLSPVESAEDLSKQTRISYGALRGGSTVDFFRNSHISTYQRMWNFMSRHRHVLTQTTEEGIERVKRGQYAFLMESAMIEYHRALDKDCEFTQVGGLIDSKGYGLGVAPNHTQLLDELTLRILQLQRDQVLQELKRKWWQGSGQCSVGNGGGKSVQSQRASRLDIHNVGGIFVVLTLGLSIAIIVAVAEFLWHSSQQTALQGNNGNNSSSSNDQHNPDADPGINASLWKTVRKELGSVLNCYADNRKRRIVQPRSSRQRRRWSACTSAGRSHAPCAFASSAVSQPPPRLQQLHSNNYCHSPIYRLSSSGASSTTWSKWPNSVFTTTGEEPPPPPSGGDIRCYKIPRIVNAVSPPLLRRSRRPPPLRELRNWGHCSTTHSHTSQQRESLACKETVT